MMMGKKERQGYSEYLMHLIGAFAEEEDMELLYFGCGITRLVGNKSLFDFVYEINKVKSLIKIKKYGVNK